MNENDPIPLQPPQPPAKPPPLPPSFPPRVLNYGSPDVAPRRIEIWQVVIGLVLSAGVLFTAFILAAMAGDFIRTAAGFFAIAGTILALVNIGSIFAFRSESLRGLTIGLWIGEGILLLLIGACFAMI